MLLTIEATDIVWGIAVLALIISIGLGIEIWARDITDHNDKD